MTCLGAHDWSRWAGHGRGHHRPASTRTWLTMGVCFALVAGMLAGFYAAAGLYRQIRHRAVRDNMQSTGELPVLLGLYCALILSGLGALIALMRFGIRRFRGMRAGAASFAAR